MSIANIDFDGSRVQSADAGGTSGLARRPDRAKLFDVAMGLGLAAFLPALFWTGLVWAFCAGFGVTISGATLATIGFAVAAFLTIVCSAMFRAG